MCSVDYTLSLQPVVNFSYKKKIILLVGKVTIFINGCILSNAEPRHQNILQNSEKKKKKHRKTILISDCKTNIKVCSKI